MKKPRCKKKFCYTRQEVSTLSGRSIWAVRRDVRVGILNMEDFMAVAKYVEKHREKK